MFHTVEGGGITFNDEALKEKLMLMRSFGHVGDDYFSIGINGKNSEFHAAMGLAVFPYVNEIISKRKSISEQYDKLLNGLPIKKPVIRTGTEYNYAYYPIIFDSEEKLLQTIDLLLKNEVGTRRYFYPSLNNLPYVKGSVCAVSDDVSRRVLCLPLYPDLPMAEVDRIAQLIKSSLL